jgi:hypothetical protein
MPLPEQIAVRYAEDDAGYLSMRPLVDQTFRLHELVDLVVSVVGKDAERVRKTLQKGAVVYNGYHYRWEPLAAEPGEVEALVAPFPEDDPSRPFDPEKIAAILFESGGGTQRSLTEVTATEAREKKLFAKTSALDALKSFAVANPPHYEKYSHAKRADLFRVTLAFESGQQLLAAMQEAAPLSLRRRWNTMRPPAVLTFVCPR